MDRFAKLATQLREKTARRPRTRTKLLALIKTDFGGKITDSEAQSKLNELVRTGVLSVDQSGKIVYPAG
jgi:hypothetical protein